MFQFVDYAQVGATKRTQDGYLVADAKVARTGIQLYRGSEVGRPDMEVVRVYRPESEVFSDATIRSFAYRPMTNNHSPEPVTADNWKDYSVGTTGGDVIRDGEFVRVPLMLMDARAIAEYESGKRELSMGYSANLIFDAGVTPAGEAYDATQTEIRNNHLALVDRARGGADLRIGDGHAPVTALPVPNNQPNAGGPPMAELRKVVVDGLTIETTEQGEQVIAKLQKQVADAATANGEAAETYKVTIAGKDAELAKKDAEIDTLKSQVMDSAALDKRVAERAELVTLAKSIADADYSGMTDKDIRTAVVKASFGDAAVEGKSQDYIDARFDILAEDAVKGAGPDPVRQAMADSRGNNPQNIADADKAYAENLSYLQTAYQGNAK